VGVEAIRDNCFLELKDIANGVGSSNWVCDAVTWFYGDQRVVRQGLNSV
jgi:hypothetical protein